MTGDMQRYGGGCYSLFVLDSPGCVCCSGWLWRALSFILKSVSIWTVNDDRSNLVYSEDSGNFVSSRSCLRPFEARLEASSTYSPEAWEHTCPSISVPLEPAHSVRARSLSPGIHSFPTDIRLTHRRHASFDWNNYKLRSTGPSSMWRCGLGKVIQRKKCLIGALSRSWLGKEGKRTKHLRQNGRRYKKP